MYLVKSLIISSFYYYFLCLFALNSQYSKDDRRQIVILNIYTLDEKGLIFPTSNVFSRGETLYFKIKFEDQYYYILVYPWKYLRIEISYRIDVYADDYSANVDYFLSVLKEEVYEYIINNAKNRIFYIDTFRVYCLDLPKISFENLPYNEDFLTELDYVIDNIIFKKESYQILLVPHDPIESYILTSAIVNHILYKDSNFLHFFFDSYDRLYFYNVFFKNSFAEFENVVFYFNEFDSQTCLRTYEDLIEVVSSFKKYNKNSLIVVLTNPTVIEKERSPLLVFDAVYYPKLTPTRLSKFFYSYVKDPTIISLLEEEEIVYNLSTLNINLSMTISTLRVLISKRNKTYSQMKKSFLSIIRKYSKTYDAVTRCNKKIGF